MEGDGDTGHGRRPSEPGTRNQERERSSASREPTIQAEPCVSRGVDPSMSHSFLQAACLAALATALGAADLPIVSIEIGPDGAVVERAGTLGPDDELVTNLPLAVEAEDLEVAIAGVQTPPAIALRIVPPPSRPEPSDEWKAAYAAAQRAFRLAQPAIERSELRVAVARSLLQWRDLVDDQTVLLSLEHQQSLRGFLVDNMEQSELELQAALQQREQARQDIRKMDADRRGNLERFLGRTELTIPGAAGKRVTIRYRVRDARWAPRYRLQVDDQRVDLVRQAIVEVPPGYTWQTKDLVLRTRALAGDAWVRSLRVPVLGLGGRRHAVSTFGGSRKSESAVEAAFKDGIRDQNEDGSWGSGPYRRHSSALNVLCFLGAGYDHKSPNRYRKRLILGLGYLREQVQRSSSITEAALITSALAEAYAMTNDQELLNPVTASLERLGSFAFGSRGLERALYEEGAMTGPKTLAWTVMAFKSARAAGLDVGTALDRCKELLPQLEGHAQRHEAAVVRLCAAVYLGMPVHVGDDPSAGAPPVDEWIKHHDHWLREGRPELVYFATLGLFGYGGEAWRAWNAVSRQTLTDVQRTAERAGGYLNIVPTPLGESGARALVTLPLEVYYRYTPIRSNAEGALESVAQRPVLPKQALVDMEMISLEQSARSWPLRFRIGQASLRSGQRQLVAIDQLALPGGVQLYAVPAVRPGAWRELRATNPQPVPLVAGPMMVVINGDMQAERQLPFIEPGAEIVVPLGREDGIRVTRRVERASEDAWGKRKEEVRLLYRVEGKPRSLSRIRIDEPMPVPADAAVHFRSLEPLIEHEDLDRRLLQDPTWHLDLKLAASGVDAALIYELRHPLDRRPVLKELAP